MANEPLTEQDFMIYSKNKIISFDKKLLQKVQSAKRLLKKRFSKGGLFTDCYILKRIDACFQIDDGEELQSNKHSLDRSPRVKPSRQEKGKPSPDIIPRGKKCES